MLGIPIKDIDSTIDSGRFLCTIVRKKRSSEREILAMWPSAPTSPLTRKLLSKI